LDVEINNTKNIKIRFLSYDTVPLTIGQRTNVKIFIFLLLGTSLVAAAGELTTDNCYEIREYLLRHCPVLKPYLSDKQLLDALTKLLILHTQCVHFTQKIQTYR